MRPHNQLNLSKEEVEEKTRMKNLQSKANGVKPSRMGYLICRPRKQTGGQGPSRPSFGSQQRLHHLPLARIMDREVCPPWVKRREGPCWLLDGAARLKTNGARLEPLPKGRGPGGRLHCTGPWPAYEYVALGDWGRPRRASLCH